MPPQSERGIFPQSAEQAIGNLDTFKPFHEDISKGLMAFGRDSAKEYIKEAYLSQDRIRAVCILEAPRALGYDHFIGNPIVRGVDLLYAMHTVSLMRAFLTGEFDKQALKPHLTRAENIPFTGSVVPPQTLTVVAWRKSTFNPYEARAAVYSGDNLVASADMIESSTFPHKIVGGEDPEAARLGLEVGPGDRYLTKEYIEGLLAGFGYGPSKMYLPELLLKRGDVWVGSLRVGKSGFSEFDGIETIAQMLAVSEIVDGNIRGGVIPLFGKIFDAQSNYRVEPHTLLWFSVKKNNSGGFGGQGEIRCGYQNVVMRAKIEGKLRSKAALDRLRSRIEPQASATPDV